MTKEEAIKIMSQMIKDEEEFLSENTVEAHKMAIEALSQEPTDEMVHVETLRQVMWERDIAIGQLKELGYGLGQKIEPCDDAVSRSLILNKIREVCFDEEWLQFRVDKGSNGQRDYLINFIEKLPSVNPQPCDDCISRQYLLNNCVVDKVTMPYVPVNKIKEAPPVIPTCEEREKGECPYYAG